jgi:hypothetical protein
LPLVVLLVASCSEEQSDIPEISNLAVTPMVAQEFTDTVLISFDYYDYNGDLGNPDPNITSLSVKDSRLQDADLYHVIPLSPEGSNVPIQGRMTVQLNNLFILGNDTVEELLFEVLMQDQKGNWSNLLESDTISVYRP